ncbi:hypothetical protein [Rhizorhabdus histidinilytica]|jgi:hypothetical protein|uniref:hypothetical protein n=1 Tax=Rhizorhabdus histidinilytica TaxID=439228 RepID=UPI0015926F98|nr:hypothetical protein [Rhizorhabdus histidinilytica]
MKIVLPEEDPAAPAACAYAGEANILSGIPEKAGPTAPEVARAYHVPHVKGNRALAKRQNPP